MFVFESDEGFEDCEILWCELFIPVSTNQYTFSLSFDIKDYNCFVSIYESDILQKTDILETGSKVGLICPELYCTVDVWHKYFFPSFCKDQYQWYHTEKGMDEIKAMAEVLEYARTRAMEIISK
jgi:hypothetical protein